MDRILHRLLDLAAARFGADRLALKPQDDMYEALRIDSMRALELLTELENEFGVEIPDYELQRVRTFEELAAVIARRC
ncbi:MAG: Acyl carrier protein [Myxococcota bacterium]|nr:Acyl carrier protein [Myxococcota bacterium]